MSKKKANAIPSYSLDDLLGNEKATLLILLEEKEDVYKQVKATQSQIEEICALLSRTRLGYQFNLYETKLIVDAVDDEDQ